jgi:hypothetical protein
MTVVGYEEPILLRRRMEAESAAVKVKQNPIHPQPRVPGLLKMSTLSERIYDAQCKCH